jgi:uncharacterized membrane protein
MADDRLEQLERRIAELEGIVRQLLTRALNAPGGRTRDLPRRAAPPSSHPDIPADATPFPVASPRVVVRPRAEPRGVEPRAALDWEQWVGQRGLLVVGVLALLATGGFFLNYAIQHGWIPPVVRATGAIIAGIALAAWGDRLVRRGMARYGAAIIGGGGGLVYLGIWAAAGPYALVGREIGVLLLAATSGGVVALAIRHSVEALAVWALTGAYLAPIFLASHEPAPAKFLAYMAVVGTSFLLVSVRVHWRATFDLALLGFFLLPGVLITREMPTALGVNYAVLGGVVALLATSESPTAWPEARLGALILVWTVLFSVGAADDARWAALVGGALLTVIAWWQQRRATPFARDAREQLTPEFFVYLTPLALVILAAVAAPSALAPWGGGVALALAVLYLGSGWLPRTLHLIVMGFTLLALAVSGQWDGTAVAAGWAVVAAIASASGRFARRPGARAVAAVVAGLAFLQLFTLALSERPSADPAFTGNWALVWYLCLVAFALTAQWWEGRGEVGRNERVGVALWSLAAATLLVGGSVELQRLFEATVAHAAVALVLYWVVFALALVRGAPLWRPALRAAALRTALVLIGGAYLLLLTLAQNARLTTDSAFVGIWSLGWYACCIGAVGAARWWPADEQIPSALRSGRAALWWAAGACLLLGGSIELRRGFTSKLAGDLAISTFWLVYAGALVRAGFWLDRKVVRSAGLGVAALAALKIVMYDLSALQALYRVGSFFVLALMTLAVAYAYNKRAKASKASAV